MTITSANILFSEARRIASHYERALKTSPIQGICPHDFLHVENPSLLQSFRDLAMRIEDLSQSLLTKDLVNPSWRRSVKKAHESAQNLLRTISDAGHQPLSEKLEIFNDIDQLSACLFQGTTCVTVPTNWGSFEKTDLVIFSDEYEDEIPINGIKAEDYQCIEFFYQQLEINNAPHLKIQEGNILFKKEILNALKVLLTRPSSRVLVSVLGFTPPCKLDLQIKESKDEDVLKGIRISRFLYYNNSIGKKVYISFPNQFVNSTKCPTTPNSLWYHSEEHKYYYVDDDLNAIELVVESDIVINLDALHEYTNQEQIDRDFTLSKFSPLSIALAHEMIHLLLFLLAPLNFEDNPPFELGSDDHCYTNPEEKRTIVKNLLGVSENDIRRDLGFGVRKTHQASKVYAFKTPIENLFAAAENDHLFDFLHILLNTPVSPYDKLYNEIEILHMYAENGSNPDLLQLIVYLFDPLEKELPPSIQSILKRYHSSTVQKLTEMKKKNTDKDHNKPGLAFIQFLMKGAWSLEIILKYIKKYEATLTFEEQKGLEAQIEQLTYLPKSDKNRILKTLSHVKPKFRRNPSSGF